MNSIVFTSKPLMEAVRDMVFIHRFSPTGDHGAFLEVSASAIRKLEYAQEELLSLTPWDLTVKVNSVIANDLRSRLSSDSSALHEQELITKSGRRIPVEFNTHLFEVGGDTFAFSIARDITDKKKREEELRALRGMLPLCSFCKKIRDDKGYWEQVDVYIKKYSNADISHSICPDCLKRHYPEEYKELYPDDKDTT